MMNYRGNASDANFIILCFFLFCIELANMILMGSNLNMVVTIPQIILVLYYTLSQKLDKALLWHVVFCVTGCDNNTVDEDVIMVSYPALKLIGPLTISYLLLGFIWIMSLRRKYNLPKISMFYELRKLFLLLFVSGTLLGIVGVLFLDFSVQDFIPPFRYMLIAVLYMDVFSRLYTKSFIEKCYLVCVCLLIVTPIATALSFFLLNISYDYSVFDSFVTTPVFVLIPTLILFLIFRVDRMQKTAMIFSLVWYVALGVSAARGSQILSTSIALAIFVWLVYLGEKRNDYVGISFFKTVLPFIGIGVFFGVSYMLLGVGKSMSSNKLDQFVSLFSMFGSIGSGTIVLDGVASSPYIRIAEILNVIDNGLSHPISLLIGQGYGGYYTDSLGLFTGLDMWNSGAFSDAAISSGRYGTAHSMYPNAILFHGLIGFFFILRMGLRYVKNIKYTPLLFAAFSFLLYSLYYNVPLMTICIMMLFASECKLNYYTKC